jgi:hypothetical protein
MSNQINTEDRILIMFIIGFLFLCTVGLICDTIKKVHSVQCPCHQRVLENKK